MTPVKRALAALSTAVVLLTLVGCSHVQAQSLQTNRLLGTWFDSASGDEYQFISDSILVVPHTQTGGGNAVTYRVFDGNRLDIAAGGSHHVSIIESIGPDALTLADPISGYRQRFYRSMSRTQHIRSLEASALAAVSDFATLTADPEIIWVAKKPTGKGAEWTDWAPTTLSAYGTAWKWDTLTRDKIPARTSGGGEAMGYSFGFIREIPTAEQLKACATTRALRRRRACNASKWATRRRKRSTRPARSSTSLAA